MKNEKNKKNCDKIISLVKPKLNITDVFIFEALIDSNISHDKFVLINNVPEGFDDMKEEIINSSDK